MTSLSELQELSEEVKRRLNAMCRTYSEELIDSFFQDSTSELKRLFVRLMRLD